MDICNHDSMINAGIQFDDLAAALVRTAHDGKQIYLGSPVK
jgi:hypothetical protein